MLKGDADSHETKPQCYHVITLDRELEMEPSPFEIKDTDGSLCKYPGVFICRGCLFVNVKWADATNGQKKTKFSPK